MINLTDFAAVGDIRGYLNAPFQDDGHAIATDACIAIIVFGAGSELPAAHEKMVGRVQTLERDSRQYSQALPISLPESPGTPCRHCKGSGLVIVTECDDCDGEGNFWHGSYEYECLACKGDGALIKPAPKGESGAKPCTSCNGSGYGFRAIDLEIDGVRYRFQEKYLKLIYGLPNHKLLVNGNPKTFARFEFDGGAGVIMPCYLD